MNAGLKVEFGSLAKRSGETGVRRHDKGCEVGLVRGHEKVCIRGGLDSLAGLNRG